MSASPAQLDELLAHCMDFARTLLSDAGDFDPFGATLSAQGKVEPVGGNTGDEPPAPQEIYKLLLQACAAGAAQGKYLGTALAANVNIPAQYSPAYPDGVRVHLESPGHSRFVYLPYRIVRQGMFTKKFTVEYAEPLSVDTKPVCFRAGTGS